MIVNLTHSLCGTEVTIGEVEDDVALYVICKKCDELVFETELCLNGKPIVRGNRLVIKLSVVED